MGKYEIWARHDKTTALQPEISYDVVLEDIKATHLAWSLYKKLYSPKYLPSHHEWNWMKKVSAATNHSFVALRYGGETHGMMMVGLDPQPGRLPGSAHKDVLYIEYLETAPWNQKPYAGEDARFVAVGTCLIDVAIDLSYAYHCEGRLGLHSLPDARGFYESQGFHNLGEDPVEHLEYFELSHDILENTEFQ